MHHKKLIYTGTAILAASLLIGLIETVWFINSSFNALRTNQTAGLGGVSQGLEYAVYIGVFEMIGILTSVILIIAGAIKAKRQSSEKNISAYETR